MEQRIALAIVLIAVMGLFGLICMGLGKAFDYDETDDAKRIDKE
jgi:hypothetical protein